MLRYLPLVVFTTVSVVILPAVLVATLVPRGSLLLTVASMASAVAVSVVIASAEAAVWTRRSGSRDLVFADLMLWGWLRRCWTERRLAHARDLYDSARKASVAVSIELLEDLSKRLVARDAYTHGHNQRVARHAERIARAMHLPAEEIAKIRIAATVHDVGKIYTPREILNNPGRLTDREYAIVKLHAGDGADMLADVGDHEITAMVRHHHERVDGNGYPDGLAGSDIPRGARIIAVADTFDAITSNRPYRPVGTHKRALDVLSKEGGSQLDSAAVAAFLSCYSARRSVAWFAFAAVVPQRMIAALQTVSPSFGSGVVTSMLPALGAAGLLTVSPSLRHDTAFERSTYGQPTSTQSNRPAIAATPTTGAARHVSRPTVSARPTGPGHHQSQRVARNPAHSPIGTRVYKSPLASTPNTPTKAPAGATTHEPTATGTGVHEPVVPVPPTAPPTTSTSTPTPPPPPPVPPVKVPALPKLPIPPVTLPSVPTVSVSVPEISVSVPGLSVSTGALLGSKAS